MKDQIAKIFDEIADMLEIMGENVFRVRAYRRGAEAVRHANDIKSENIPGIGKDLHAKILEIYESGECKMHQELSSKLAPGILNLLRVRGLGPKKVKLFNEHLGIDSIEKLKAAALAGQIATLPGMGEKSQTAILESLSQNTHTQKRVPYATARAEADAILEYMRECPGIELLECAGSLRRESESIGDIDILACGADAEVMSTFFIQYPRAKQVLARGETKSSLVIDLPNLPEHVLQIDFRAVDRDSFGAALYYFTGPKQYNIHVRTIAMKKGYKVNEYGVFDGEEKLAGRDEKDMFTALDLPELSPKERDKFA